MSGIEIVHLKNGLGLKIVEIHRADLRYISEESEKERRDKEDFELSVWVNDRNIYHQSRQGL